MTPLVRIYNQLSFDEKQAIANAGEKQFNRILPREKVNEMLEANENYFTMIQRKNKNFEKEGSRIRYGLIPCKKCYACRLNYSAEWAVRIMHEVKQHKENYFVTLTYDHEHVPTLDYVEYKDKEGNIQRKFNNGCFHYSLNPKDLDTFIDSLRKNQKRHHEKKDFKYYLAAEYGGEGARPHYHIIFMGLELDGTKFYSYVKDENGKDHWKSKELERIWKKGIIDVAKVEFADAAYVARYGTKLFINRGSEEDYAEQGMVREFTRCSTRPAIGSDYIKSNEYDMLISDGVLVKNSKGNVFHVKLPAYYQKRLEQSYPEYMDEQKNKRQSIAINSLEKKREQTNISDKERLKRDTMELARRGALLKRENIDKKWDERQFIPKQKL